MFAAGVRCPPIATPLSAGAICASCGRVKKKEVSSEDSLIEVAVQWVQQEVKTWSRYWEGAEKFDFKALEGRFRRDGLALLGMLFEELIQRQPLILPPGARCPHCGLGALKRKGFRNKLLATTVSTNTVR